MLTQEKLKELLTYCPDTGQFIRNFDSGKGGRFKAGSVAGGLNKVNGYVEIWVANKSYLAHRLAFLYMTGAFPKHGVDHVDLNRSNNAWANLRAATQLQNTWNMPRSKINTSGFKGVSKRKDTGAWSARIKAEGRYLSLGSFDTPEAAAQAYQNAAVKYRGEFARS